MKQSRDFLISATRTEVGRLALRDLYGDSAEAIIAEPLKGDDESIVIVAEQLRTELHRRYPTMF